MICPICSSELRNESIHINGILWDYHCSKCCVTPPNHRGNRCRFKLNSNDGTLTQCTTNKVFKIQGRLMNKNKIIGKCFVYQQ